MKNFYITIAILLYSMIACAQFTQTPTLSVGDASFLLEDAKIFLELDYTNTIEYNYSKTNKRVEEVYGPLLDSARLGDK